MTKSTAELLPPAHAVETSSGFTWLDEDGILIAIGSSQQLHSLEQAIENIKISAELAGALRRPFLIDMNKVKNMSREAREYYAGPEPQNTITAVAIVTNSSVGKAVANFFMALTKPALPTRMFTDFTEARLWLLQYKENKRDL